MQNHSKPIYRLMASKQWFLDNVCATFSLSNLIHTDARFRDFHCSDFGPVGCDTMQFCNCILMFRGTCYLHP
jgi:hypothetical protein